MGNLTFEELCGKLVRKENFSFSRWGDGEWACVLGDKGQNCDGHPYYPDMSLSLAAILLADQTHYMGLQPKCVRDMGARVYKWMDEHGTKIDWCNADILHDASIAGRMDEFARALQTRKIVLVANSRLQQIAHNFRAPRINVPDKYAWKWYHTIYGDLMGEIDKDCVILYCMGMASNVMIAQLQSEYGDTITQIDCGSVFSPYVGESIRRYHQQIIERMRNQ